MTTAKDYEAAARVWARYNELANANAAESRTSEYVNIECNIVDLGALKEAIAEERAAQRHAAATAALEPRPREGDMLQVVDFCPRCLASSEDGSWGCEAIAGHCFNCGASGCTEKLTRWAVMSIREQASWVGKRYYPHDEDRERVRTVGELRAAIQGCKAGHEYLYVGPDKQECKPKCRRCRLDKAIAAFDGP